MAFIILSLSFIGKSGVALKKMNHPKFFNRNDTGMYRWNWSSCSWDVWIFHYFMILSAIERCISRRIIKQSKSFSIHVVCFKLPQYKNSWIALNFIKAHFTLNISTSGHLSKEGHSIKSLYQGFSGMHILGIYLHSKA